MSQGNDQIIISNIPIAKPNSFSSELLDMVQSSNFKIEDLYYDIIINRELNRMNRKISLDTLNHFLIKSRYLTVFSIIEHEYIENSLYTSLNNFMNLNIVMYIIIIMIDLFVIFFLLFMKIKIKFNQIQNMNDMIKSIVN